jgi:D-alanyl-lipoteichoic acid acyltransferase DltB (MBOAT superfamily)
MGYYLARIFAGYWAHSGRASVHIGMIRAFGFEVPERYHLPFLASHPADFWRRWNTYVGSWFRRYVFAPAAVDWQRRRVLSSRNAANAAAVIVTFLSGGLAHDFSVYLRFGRTALGGTIAFAVHGLALVGWALAREIRGRIRIPAWIGAPLRPVGTVVAYALFLHVLVVSCWIALPGLGEGALPRELVDVFGVSQ